MAGASLSVSKGSRAGGDWAKTAFFVALAAAVLLVIWTDERFLVLPHDPFWGQIAPFKGVLLFHGLFGATALALGPLQFSDRLRKARPRLHRWLGRVYVGAICVAAPLGGFIGIHFAGSSGGLPRMMIVEQAFQSGGWLFATLMALACILRRNIPAHKVWMMRSYAFCTIFIISRVPDAIPNFHWNDQLLTDFLWGLVVAACLAPDVIMTVRELARRRPVRA
ncbi:MAG: DUF2306 domain-containing protein [Alphaproteobacteria bacterium]|nr:DUF2306 domain-containing protein [Alphaproteobacteria bacterium]